MNKKKALENLMEKVNSFWGVLVEEREKLEAEPAEDSQKEKALDMVKHLTAAFGLPVFIGVDEDAALVRADGEKIKPEESLVGPDEFCIIRTYSAGVFAGYIEHMEGQTAVLRDSRRIWSWKGACSLSQLAVDGTCKPDDCRFAVMVEREIVKEVIEIIPCTEKARESIWSVKEWKM